MNEVNCNGAGELPGHEGEGSYGDYEGWYEKHVETLKEEFIKNNPEYFPTEEEMIEVENNCRFQDFCEERYKDTGMNEGKFV